MHHQGDLLIPTSRAARKPPNSGDVSASLQSPRSPPTGGGDNRTHRTEAERDDSRTKIPLTPKKTHNTCSVTEDLEGQKESSVEYKDGRINNNAGVSTNVWSSLEQDMNCGHSQNGLCSGKFFFFSGLVSDVFNILTLSSLFKALGSIVWCRMSQTTQRLYVCRETP